MNVPEAVGVPLIVIVLAAKDAVTPAGRLVGAPIPVAPVVVIVIFGEIGEFRQTEGLLEGTPAVFAAFTVIVPVAFTVPQPPVSGML